MSRQLVKYQNDVKNSYLWRLLRHTGVAVQQNPCKDSLNLATMIFSGKSDIFNFQEMEC